MLVGGKAKYHGVLDIPAGIDGAWTVQHVLEPAGKTFHLSNARTQIMGGDRFAPITFDHPTRWHMLTEDGQRWMSDLPIEQAQHDRELRPMRGTVLVGGLGLGYAATALLRRRTVHRVVVVEKAPEVVRLVEPYLLRGSALRSKLSVVEADLFDYLRAYQGQPFNWAFYDIWASDGEGTFFQSVCPLRALSVKVARNVVCWNENVMRGQLYFSLESRLIQLDPQWSLNAEQLTLAMLAEERGSIWWDWAVPFFRWVRDQQPDPKRQRAGVAAYAKTYGLPGLDWQRLVA